MWINIGYNYVHNANSKGLKIIWMLVILLMTGLGVYLLSKQTAEFMEARIVTNIETSTASLKVISKHSLLIYLMLFFYKTFLYIVTYSL